VDALLRGGGMRLVIVPVTFRQACAFIEAYHRHHRPVLVENSVTGSGLEFHAVGRYSLSSPPRHCRRPIPSTRAGNAIMFGSSSGARRSIPSLESTGWQRPDGDTYPTGKQWAELYLQPLAKALGDRVRLESPVTGVARRGRDRVVDAGRDTEPLTVHVGDERITAKAVIDAHQHAAGARKRLPRRPSAEVRPGGLQGSARGRVRHQSPQKGAVPWPRGTTSSRSATRQPYW
jgi:hypothetical protein